MIQSPLNYTGGKYKLLSQILPLFPSRITTFVDLFCGGCNVGINVTAKNHIYNDKCIKLIKLYELMNRCKSEDFVEKVEQIIQKYNLSDVKRNGYDFYGCCSKDGLSGYNKEGYFRLMSYVNTKEEHDDEYYNCSNIVLIVFCFLIINRFKSEWRIPISSWKTDFNLKMKFKLTEFMDHLHQQNATFSHLDFNELDLVNLGENDFVYADPPYLITCASYNEQDGWTEEHEYALLHLLDGLNERNIRFALSNVIESKGRINTILQEWIDRQNYRVINLNFTYKNSNYQRKNKESETKEILVINY